MESEYIPGQFSCNKTGLGEISTHSTLREDFWRVDMMSSWFWNSTLTSERAGNLVCQPGFIQVTT